MLSSFTGALRNTLRRPFVSLTVTDHLGRERSRYRMPKVTRKRGLNLTHDPFLNKGTGFPPSERLSLSLRGLVPPRVLSLEAQADRILERIRGERKPIRKYALMSSLMDRNVELFYYVLCNNLAELTPVVYTPTVGEACQKFSEMYRRTHGMFFSRDDQGHFAEMVFNWPEQDVDVIVVTEGGRVLGLGDLGAGAMGISVGKSILYCAAGGIEPSRILPVMLDVGTNNEDLLEDPYYMGVPEKRLKGEEYFALVEEFLDAVRSRWPRVLVQFEDFGSDVAAEVLRRYRRKHLCFNDDVQGTGAMALGGLISAARGSMLKDHRIVVAGAGSAGMGVSKMIHKYLVVREGLTPEEAYNRFWVVDKDGLITDERENTPLEMQHKGFSRSDTSAFVDGTSLLDIVKATKATVLLGVSGVHGLFTEDVVKAMAENTESPIIFPMSNPTSKCEATAEEVIRWTDGKGVFASGSPFDDVEYNGRTYCISQSNNMSVFPGMGLASVICRPTRISEEMFLGAAKCLGNFLSKEDQELGLVYPRIDDMREVAIHVCAAVCEVAWETGIARAERPENLIEHIRNLAYVPCYDPVVPYNGSEDAQYI